MKLQNRSLCIIALILFLALSINTAVLTYVAYDRVKQGAIMKQELNHLLSRALPVSFAVFILFTIVSYFLVSRYAIEPIINIEKVLRKMTTGDMTGKVAVTGKDEIASLSDAINTMSTSLSDMIDQIKGLASSVSTITSSITEFQTTSIFS